MIASYFEVAVERTLSFFGIVRKIFGKAVGRMVRNIGGRLVGRMVEALSERWPDRRLGI